ncbi:DUF2975 domain-containing protein [Nocardiopsis suaedae]|uniref:DUF2975 domain-containing protein n=1 Tax=Nocardiopsis suaedae TaxID=3018444 RepID=A0ABT4TNJ6_9ACTN|nr:DUF2975 domain-containing protein [Nocardiopsis suaedae]MDA2806259.1 DUF2975 domain-containing protein [Nocardiopsis suaedae]
MPSLTHARVWLQRLYAFIAVAGAAFGAAAAALAAVIAGAALGVRIPLAETVVSVPVDWAEADLGAPASGGEAYGSVDVAVTDPTAGQVLLSAGPDLVQVLLLLAGALVLASAVGKARTDPFAPDVARRVRVIGWLAVFGSLGGALLESVASAVLASTVVDADGWFAGMTLPLPFLLMGVGMFAVAAILGVGAEMRDDLEGTV